MKNCLDVGDITIIYTYIFLFYFYIQFYFSQVMPGTSLSTSPHFTHGHCNRIQRMSWSAPVRRGLQNRTLQATATQCGEACCMQTFCFSVTWVDIVTSVNSYSPIGYTVKTL